MQTLNETRLLAFWKGSRVIAWMKDEAGRYVFVSENCSRHHQTEPDAWLGRTDAEIWPEDIAIPLRENDLAVIQTGKTIQAEEQTICSDGRRTWWMINKFLFTDANGSKFVGGLAVDITERKQAEMELREKEERYRMLANHTDDIVGLNDLQGGRLYISPSYFRKTGWTQAEVLTTDWRTRLHPEDLPAVERAREANLRGTPTSIEHRTLCKDGSWLWLETHCKPLLDEQGKVWRLLTWSHDITARRQTEEELRESQLRYRLLVESLPQLVWTCEADGPCDYLSPQWLEYTGLPEAEQLGDGWTRQLHPDDRKPTQVEWQRAVERGSPLECEFRIRRHDGIYRWFHTQALPLRNSEGRIIKWFGTNTDIDDLKSAEAEYRRELEFTRVLVSKTSALIVLFDEEARFLHTNRAAAAISGYSEEELAGRALWEVGMTRPEDEPRLREMFRRQLAGEDNPLTEIRLRTKTGEWRAVEISSTATRKADGGIDRIIVTGIDVTEKSRLQQEVLSISEQEHARIGHDLHDGVGQTLTGIASLLEALEADLSGPQQKNAACIRELVQQSVLEVRRMSHGLSPAAVRNRGLGGSLQLLAETVRNNYRTACSCEIDTSIVITDPDKETHLYRIAQEAVNNAIRHGRPKQVRLKLLRLNAAECEMRVTDNGRGLKNRPNGEGHGIGLRVMSYRAGLIGGLLKITKQPSGAGVSVSCRFPAAEKN